MTRPDQTYLDTLTLYYEEEVEGEAYFRELAGVFTDPEHKEKIVLLAEVERHAAEAVVPLLRQYGLTPRPADVLSGSGRAEARATPPDWGRLIDGMAKTYPGYLDAFKSLEAMAPPGDLPRLTFLTEHEVAAIEFLEIETRDPAQSAAPLRAYLATTPEAWADAGQWSC